MSTDLLHQLGAKALSIRKQIVVKAVELRKISREILGVINLHRLEFMGVLALEVKPRIAYSPAMSFFRKLIEFIRAVAGDPRIPDRDKAVILALLALIISP